MMNIQDLSAKLVETMAHYPYKKDTLSTGVRNDIVKILMGLICCASTSHPRETGNGDRYPVSIQEISTGQMEGSDQIPRVTGTEVLELPALLLAVNITV